MSKEKTMFGIGNWLKKKGVPIEIILMIDCVITTLIAVGMSLPFAWMMVVIPLFNSKLPFIINWALIFVISFVGNVIREERERKTAWIPPT